MDTLTKRLCPDCAAVPGEPHQDGCDVARCVVCGMQALGCDDHPNAPMQTWSGIWPGVEEAREYGWWSKRASIGWVPCAADDPNASEDINRVMTQCHWDPERGRFVRPDLPNVPDPSIGSIAATGGSNDTWVAWACRPELSDDDLETVRHLLFKFGRGGYPGGTFTQHLLAAIATADIRNKSQLAKAFPAHVGIYQAMAYRTGALDAIAAADEARIARERAGG